MRVCELSVRIEAVRYGDMTVIDLPIFPRVSFGHVYGVPTEIQWLCFHLRVGTLR
jgi:hypothetical protein